MDAQARSDAAYDRMARTYEDEPGHGIHGVEECRAWDRDLDRLLPDVGGWHVLDIGAGTGVFSRLLAGRGCHVLGIDSSPGMVDEARRHLPSGLAGRVSYRVGDTHETGLFDRPGFDAVVSRQMVCHLHDPLLAFRNWRRWLKPDGTVLVVDGFWPREGWARGEMGQDVDVLPLCCVQTAGTAAYLLRAAGFVVEPVQYLEEVNRLVAVGEPGATRRSPRYAILGASPSASPPTGTA